MMSSSIQSQTLKEHHDLMKYERNLASCYEAEYLLSLRLEEYHNNTSDSSTDDGLSACLPDSYDYEYAAALRETYPNTDTIGLSSMDREVTTQNGGALLDNPVQFENVLLEESMDTTNTDHLGSNGSGCHLQFCEEEVKLQSSINHAQSMDNQSSFFSPTPCTFTNVDTNIAHGMGCSNTHCEGPSRKRICLHQSDL